MRGFRLYDDELEGHAFSTAVVRAVIRVEPRLLFLDCRLIYLPSGFGLAFDAALVTGAIVISVVTVRRPFLLTVAACLGGHRRIGGVRS